MANRIQVFTKDGKFLKEFMLATYTGAGGSAGGVMFSPDREQRLLYISDLTNNHIGFLNREDGKVLGQMGHSGGEFFGLHMEAVDSKKSFTPAKFLRASAYRDSCPSSSSRDSNDEDSP